MKKVIDQIYYLSFFLPSFHFYMRLILLYIILSASLSSCNYTKYLPEDKKLLLENTISFNNVERIQQRDKISEELLEIASPKPNLSIGLGMKPKLGLYNLGGEPKKRKSLQGFIKYKLGEAPVGVDTFRTSRATRRMEKYLQDQGYLNSVVTYSLTFPKERKAVVNYAINTQGNYKIESVTIPTGSTLLHQVIQENKGKSFLKPGRIYSLNHLERERERITYDLRNEGYYEFSKEYIYFLVDSTRENQGVRIDMRIKSPPTADEHTIYTIRDIYITPDYYLDSIAVKVDTLLAQKYTLTKFTHTRSIDTSTLNQILLVRKDERFSERRNENTISHFLNLGIFKFVQVDYTKVENQQLDCYIQLTPGLNQTVSVDLEADTRTGTLINGFGISISNSYSNRNIFKGGEEFNINLQGGLVLDPADSSAFVNSLDAGIRLSLAVPRLLLPFNLKSVSNVFLPTTRISTSYLYQERVNFYTLGDAGFSFNYEWNQNASIIHQLFPISLEFINLLRTSERFEEFLADNPFLRTSFNDVLIIGPKYTFTFNQKATKPRNSYSYFKGTIDLSGNIANGILSIFNDNDQTLKLFGQPFAQYTRVDADFRHYIPLDRRRTLAGRIFTGVGYAYGNSDLLPFVKQYFIGGPNSIRAFPFRQLGPGSFTSTLEGLTQSSFVDQAGEFVLETNLEYRFDMFSTFLEGALFLDGGNIWLIKEQTSESLSDSEIIRQRLGILTLQRFLRQFALGTGFGLRLDFSFFILRADVAFPIRDPREDRGEEWVIDDIRPFDADWRQDELQLNIAIGYPF